MERLLLDLYRLARELPLAIFQESALELLKPHLDFASAIWGAGKLINPGIRPYAMHTHNVDPEAAVHWSQINGRDKVIPIIEANRGRTVRFHAPSLFREPGDAAMREYAALYGRQSYMITAFPSSNPEMFRWLSLYRPNPDHQYMDHERYLCQGLMPHFSQALQINQSVNQLAIVSEAFDKSAFLALVDKAGTIQFAQEGFLKLLQDEWCQFEGKILPHMLTNAVMDSGIGSFTGRRIRCEWQPAGDLILIRARLLNRLDHLSPRRNSIARLYASGQSHKEIAKRLQISPATVRNHLASCFQELGISSKAELAALAKGKL